MNKITKIMTVLIIMMFTRIGMADITNDMHSAYSLLGSNNYVMAQAAFEKVIVDYPESSIHDLALAQEMIGHCLIGQVKYDLAQFAFEKVINNYPKAYVNILSDAQIRIGHVLRLRKKYSSAQAAYAKVISEYPFAPASTKANAQFNIGICLKQQNKINEAQIEYVKAALDFGFISIQHQQMCISAIDWRKLGPVSSYEYLEQLLLLVPATEENSEFLGKVKSKLEVLK